MAGRKTRLRLILVLLAISVSCRVLLAQPADAPPGEKLAYSVRDLTVQVVSSHGQNRDDNAAEGYGFVVAQQGDILTIATADHVVRDPDGAEFGEVWVVFYSDQGHPQPATVLDLRLPPADGDLAVLEVKKPGFRMAQSPVAALPLTQGERAWRVGKQRGWTPGNVPGVFTGTERTIWLAFDNLDTPRGSSGGPIVVEQGLVGMVTDIEFRAGSGPAHQYHRQLLPREGIALGVRPALAKPKARRLGAADFDLPACRLPRGRNNLGAVGVAGAEGSVDSRGVRAEAERRLQGMRGLSRDGGRSGRRVHDGLARERAGS